MSLHPTGEGVKKCEFRRARFGVRRQAKRDGALWCRYVFETQPKRGRASLAPALQMGGSIHKDA